MDKEGIVYQSLLDDDYKLLAKYIDVIDIIGIEPMSSLESLCSEGRKNSSISSKKLNHTIKNLSYAKSIPVVFNDNAMVINKN